MWDENLDFCARHGLVTLKYDDRDMLNLDLDPLITKTLHSNMHKGAAKGNFISVWSGGTVVDFLEWTFLNGTGISQTKVKDNIERK